MARSLPLVVIPLSLAACSKAPPPPPTARAVRVVEVRPAAAADARRYAGTLEARQRVELAFRVPGRVRSLAEVTERGTRRPIQDGDPVRRGQVLASLDERDLSLQAQAATAAAAAAEADVAAAQAAAGQAQAEVERARSLASSGAVAKAELDRAEAAAAAARARLEAARGQRSARGEQAALARRTTEDLHLASPLDGVVARRFADVGENAGPGQISFVLIDTAEMRLAFAAPDARIGAIRAGDRIPVRVEVLPDLALVGVVSKIDPVADPVTRTFRVELSLPNEGARLRAGMVATAAPDAAARSAGARVPLESVVRRPGGTGFAVWGVDPQASAARLRPVELGDVVGNEVEVEKGLAVGDRVVAAGAALLREGEKVEVLP